jgi:hypothetical protein
MWGDLWEKKVHRRPSSMKAYTTSGQAGHFCPDARHQAPTTWRQGYAAPARDPSRRVSQQNHHRAFAQEHSTTARERQNIRREHPARPRVDQDDFAGGTNQEQTSQSFDPHSREVLFRMRDGSNRFHDHDPSQKSRRVDFGLSCL